MQKKRVMFLLVAIKLVERNPNPPSLPPRNKIKRSAADFPVSLFQWRNDK